MRNDIKKRIIKDRQMYLLLLPVILFFIIWHYIPMWGARIAFQNVRYIGPNQWAGFRHFKLLFSSPVFFNVLKNTLIISAMKMFLIFPLPIILAFMLSEVASTGYRKAIQSVIYLPHFLSWVVIAGLFISLLASPDGAVNKVLIFFHIKPTAFMTSTKWIRWVFVVSEIWRSIGWDSILYVAAINSISPTLYEAATIDGATSFQQALKITLPSIIPTIITVFILNMGFFMNAGFDQVFNMMNDAVINTVDIIDTYVYRVGLMDANYSLGTAAGLFKSIIGLFLIISTDRVSRKTTGEGLW
ncbi:MAG: sugar ABC transporter permease [Spirochaetales bacterium]|nr:sugar ABC transporter permease [Spirochaetales bacterium]